MAEANKTSSKYSADLNAVLDGLVDDLATVRTALNTAMTKLNSDGGVTDTNYAACATLATTKD